MRTLRTLVILARSLVILTIGIAGAAVSESLLTGTWQSKMGDLAAVTLTLKNDGGKLSGTVIFYLLTRATERELLGEAKLGDIVLTRAK